jgi:ECF sigma factor
MTPFMAGQPTGSSSSSGRRSGDKAGLSAKRRRRTVENDEYGEFVRRILRAYSRRVADGDIEALALMTGLADELDEAIAQAVKGLRDQGYSWTEIGDRLNISRQAARRRWTGR